MSNVNTSPLFRNMDTAGIYLFKVNDGNTRTVSDISSELTKSDNEQ